MVSSRLAMSAESTAASLLPLMVMLTNCAVPSSESTVKLSLRLSPTFSASTSGLPLSRL
ncbi:hypothetical protein D3C80_1701420 [compost metagenome]